MLLIWKLSTIQVFNLITFSVYNIRRMPRCSKCLETKRNQKVLGKMEEKKLGLFFCLLFSIVLVFQSGNAETVSEQQKKDLVTSLPGVSFNVSFSHYAGYVNVNESSGRWLFYWFIEAAEDPSSKPLVIWLEGGPGCSGLAFGQAVQIGPFRVTPDGKTLRLNPYSWNQVANIIFLEFPVGTGFSYSTNPSDVLTNGDKRTAEDSLVFLLKWFERFPQYKGRDFYIVGESYAGHYVPQLAQAIVRYQQSKSDKSINLKGYMVGNPLIDDFNDHTGFSQFWWSLGLISDKTYKLYNALCINESFFHRSAQCMNITSRVSSDVGNIDSFSIFTPPCTRNVSATNGTIKRSSKAELLNKKYDPCTENYAEIYFNLPEVQKALHVNPDAAPARWELCSGVVDRNYKDSASTVLDIFHESISLGLRIWVYSGNADGIIPVTSTRYSINALKLPTSSPWRAWYDEGQVGGHTQEYVGLNFVTVLGAGHKVILTRPKFSLVLFKSFLAGTSMPSS